MNFSQVYAFTAEAVAQATARELLRFSGIPAPTLVSCGAAKTR
jgi:hypothetical protein